MVLYVTQQFKVSSRYYKKFPNFEETYQKVGQIKSYPFMGTKRKWIEIPSDNLYKSQSLPKNPELSLFLEDDNYQTETVLGYRTQESPGHPSDHIRCTGSGGYNYKFPTILVFSSTPLKTNRGKEGRNHQNKNRLRELELNIGLLCRGFALP